MLNKESNYVTDNVLSYITSCMCDSGWNHKKLGCFDVAYMPATEEQTFNYSCFNRSSGLEEPDEEALLKLYQYSIDHKLDLAFPVDAHMKKTRDWLAKMGVEQVSDPFKAVMKIRKKHINPIIYGFEPIEGFELVPANTDQNLDDYSKSAGRVFGHKNNRAIIGLLKCLIGKEYNKSTRTQFFVAKVNGKQVGSCGMHMDDNNVAGFYSDAILPEHRGNGYGQQLIFERIKLAEKYGCEYAIAHCITEASVSLYPKMKFNLRNRMYNYLFRGTSS